MASTIPSIESCGAAGIAKVGKSKSYCWNKQFLYLTKTNENSSAVSIL